MKKKLLVVVAASLLLAACNDTAKVDEVTPAVIEEQTETYVDHAHTSQNALDYAGTYKALYPCADCSGINMELVIDYDGNYTLDQTYLDTRDGDQTFSEKGRFTWNKAGQVITLEGTTGGPDDTIRYFVGENVLFPADKDGKFIETDTPFDYTLHKAFTE